MRNEFVTMDMFEEARNYWMRKLSGEPGEIRLIPGVVPDQEHRKSEYRVLFDNHLEERLQHISSRKDLLLYVILLTAFKILVYKYIDQEDIAVAAPTLKQSSQNYNKCVIFRDILNPHLTFKELLMKVKQTVVDGHKHQYYPINKLLKLLKPGPGTSLFRVIFLLENIHHREFFGDDIDGFANDLTISLRHSRAGIEGTVTYDSGPGEGEWIQRLFKSYLGILRQVLKDTKITLKDIHLTSPQEREVILHEFNRPLDFSPGNQTIAGWFQDTAETFADNTAVVFEDQIITYRQLDTAANALTRHLTAKGVTSGTIVGIMVHRSIRMIIGLLGILKTGAAYMPIDPQYPQARQEFMLKDSSSGTLLTTRYLKEQDTPLLKAISPAMSVILDQDDSFAHEKAKPGTLPQPGHLLYITYTSGSTGKPKGVPVSHGNFVNLIHRHQEVFGETHKSRLSQVASIGFDAMAFEVWPGLVRGASLYIADDMVRIDPLRMKEWLISRGITLSFQPTMMAERLLQEQWPDRGTALDILRTAGEQLKTYPQHLYPFQLYNLYGPTEDTVWTTWYKVEVKPGKNGYPPIGKPVGNHQVYILGKDLALKPVGAPGELCIAGAGVTRGYLNRPLLTAEKFVKNPYASNTHSFLYRTGDLACWQPDGNIEFLGRLDQQVKIRGFRIEIGEIESQLMDHPGIKETIVTIAEDKTGDRYLCAYVVPVKNADGLKQNTTFTAAELREYLSRRLPDYMLPAYYTVLEQLPLTPAGKVNRKSLPKPEITKGQDYIAPRTRVEKVLVQICSRVLGIQKETIGIDTDFFQLGGHSLKAIAYVSMVHKEFHVKIPLTEIFKITTIRQSARYIEQAGKEVYAPIIPVEKKEYYALSSAQQRLYFLRQVDEKNTAYNMPQVQVFQGSSSQEKLAAVFKQLIHRHESLRTSFHWVKGQPVQKIHETNAVELEIEQLAAAAGNDNHKLPQARENVETIIKNFIRPFDLDQAPLMRVGVVKLLHPPAAPGSTPSQESKEHEYILMVDMHHIISDAISLEILMEDFAALYEGKELPTLKLHYKDFSEWQTNEKKKHRLKQQEKFWLKEFENTIPVLNLPTDTPRTEMLISSGDILTFEIGPNETRELKKLADLEEATLYMILLAIFYVLLSKVSGDEDIVVGIPLAGRMHADVQRIIGMFVNTLPLRNYPSSDKTFREFLKEVKEKTLAAFDNQEYQFEDLVDKRLKKRDMSRHPMFDVIMAFQDMDREPVASGNDANETGISPGNTPGNKTAKMDMVVTAFLKRGRLNFIVSYSTLLYKRKTLDFLVKSYYQIAARVIENIDIPLKEIWLTHHLVAAAPGIIQEQGKDFEF